MIHQRNGCKTMLILKYHLFVLQESIKITSIDNGCDMHAEHSNITGWNTCDRIF